ncbi:hypothetical protein BGZ76_006006 [Entomortierella beljakovae]|nr:hypothetical protein BGZ76_006006 [Entomortierella beljakovae]
MASTIPPVESSQVPTPVAKVSTAETSTTSTTATDTPSRKKSQRGGPRNKDKEASKNATKDLNKENGDIKPNSSKLDLKEGKTPKKDQKALPKVDPASIDASSSSPQSAAPVKQRTKKRRNSKAPKNTPSAAADVADAVSSPESAIPPNQSSSKKNQADNSKKQQSDTPKKNGGRQPSKKRGKGDNSSQSQDQEGTSPDANKSPVEPTIDSNTTKAPPTTLTPKRKERLSTLGSTNTNDNKQSNNNDSNNGINNDNNNTSINSRRKSTNSSNGQSKKKSAKEPNPSTVTDDVITKTTTDADSPLKKKTKEKGPAPTNSAKNTQPKDTTPTASKKGNRKTETRSNKANGSAPASDSNNSRRNPVKEKSPKNIKGSKEKEDVESKPKHASSTREARPSSISSSCSFMTSSSSLSPTSPTSPTSPISFSSSPHIQDVHPLSPAKEEPRLDFEPKDVAANQGKKETQRDGANNKNTKGGNVAPIKTTVSGNFSAPSSAGSGYNPSLFSPSPSSRRSSALGPLGEKFGRHGGGLPTVEEAVSEKQSAPKRGHTRNLSMQDQLDILALRPQDPLGEGKALDSLQQVISSLKSLPPTQNSVGDQMQGHGTSRHEKRLSMSSLTSAPRSSRNSFSGMGSASTTTLHISQPPRGTSIEDALQSTVAKLRRLSVTETRRPLVSLKEDEIEDTSSGDKSGQRRSVAFTNNPAETMDSKRTSATPGFKPGRRSIVVRPEEVAALQGKQYVRGSFGSSSDEEFDGVAGALSALEGKGTSSNRSSISAKGKHSRSSSSVDPSSLAEFTSKLPSHMKGFGGAALVNNDDAHDRRRFTTAFHSPSAGRASVQPLVGGKLPTSKRLSAIPVSRESDSKDWRNSTPAGHGKSNRESVSFKDGAGGRRPLFTAHLTYSDFHSLSTKQKNIYVQGVLRINKRNRSDAYVTVDSLPDGDVYICGSKDRNRALEGDVVGIELIDSEELARQKLEFGKNKKNIKREDGAEELGEVDLMDIKPKYCGRVVSIVERSTSQMFSGTLTIMRPSGSKKSDRKNKDDEDQPRIVWFKPTDKRVPLIAIPIDQAPADFVENHAAYLHKLFVATIKRWPLSSLHPFGQLERELGDIGNIEIETEALLADNNVTTTPFGEKVEKCLPEIPWTISEKEISKRRDLRKDCIFTIDPSTAKDLDDAVSCTRLEDGNFEIGVHIADVSHFIKSGSALDREAKLRSTTVYLVQKAIPMLPNILCEDLCSLTANVDRLAFSVFWKMTEDGQVLDTTFSKSVIKSCAQLSYDDAQNVIVNGSLDPSVEVVGQPRSLVEENIKIFFKLSQILRAKRFENGALSINSIRLSFNTDEIFNPTGVFVYDIKDSNKLIEEFMLLANMSVAKKISEHFPEQALLRRHEEPLEKRMLDFISHMNKIGLNLDASSSGALQRSLDEIEDPDMRKVVRLLVIKPMQRAKYICSGMLDPEKYHHYALNAPLYTHFTSPIRRYADVIVHRMLEASLTGDSKFYLSKEACQKTANHCNIKKDAAKLAQEQSSLIYLSVLLRNIAAVEGDIVREAIVVQVLDAAFDILIPEYGIEKRVYLDQLPLERFTWNGTTETLKLYWTTEPFKAEEEEETPNFDDKSRRLSALAPHHDFSMDHPDDATNAYDDERGLFDDESDYEDEVDIAHAYTNGAPPGEEEDDLEGDSHALRLTRIKMFERIQVMIVANTKVSPPIIKVMALNPYAVIEVTGDASK